MFIGPRVGQAEYILLGLCVVGQSTCSYIVKDIFVKDCAVAGINRKAKLCVGEEICKVRRLVAIGMEMHAVDL